MNIVSYFQNAFQELHHVTWPTQKQMMRLTAITIGFTIATAIFIGAMDYVFKFTYTFLLNL